MTTQDAIERLREIAIRDEARKVMVDTADLRALLAALDWDGGCPICADRSTFTGDPAESFCDRHYRQYLATLQLAPSDLAKFRQPRLNAIREGK